MDGRIELLQTVLHYGGHWLVPFVFAFVFARVLWREEWKRLGAVMIAANLIDLDHLLADPIFDPNRCSVGFHMLHGWEAGVVYAIMLCVPRWWVRALGFGALWHLLVDWGDCLAMSGALL